MISTEANKTAASLPEQLLSVEDTASLLSISTWTVRAWVRSGRLSSVKLGARVLLPASEIQRVIDGARRPAVTLEK
jgi:excisionase family DNA binding protein